MIEVLSSAIKENILNSNNPDGLLIQEETAYLNCLELQHEEFERLLKKDEAHWAEH